MYKWAHALVGVLILGCAGVTHIASTDPNLAHATDLPGYQPNGTCRDAIAAEAAKGSRPYEPLPPNPYMKNRYGAVEFKRTFNGSPATVAYLCHGTKKSGGSVVAELIWVESTEQGIQNEFTRQKQIFEAAFGPPCFDPARISEKDRQLVPKNLIFSITTWKLPPGFFIDMNWGRGGNGEWHVVINSHATPVDYSNMAEPYRTLYAASACTMHASKVQQRRQDSVAE